MTAEVPLQRDLFDEEELKDTRTRRQKQAAKAAAAPQQATMFSQREVAQFGVRARPQMPAVSRSGKPLKMVLHMEDPRTEEEKERDRQREAEEKTYSLLGWQLGQDLERGQELLNEMKQLAEQLEGIAAMATVMLTQAQEITQRLEQTLAAAQSPEGKSPAQQTRPTLPLRTPGQLAQDQGSMFGPGFHLQRPVELHSPDGADTVLAVKPLMQARDVVVDK